MVVAASRYVRCHRPVVCAPTVFRSAATAIYQNAPRYGTSLRCWSVNSRATRCIHSVLPGTHGCTTLVHPPGDCRCEHAYGRSLSCFSLRFQTQNCPSPSMGHSQLLDCARVHRRSVCSGNHWLGSSRCGNRAGNDLVMSRTVGNVCRHINPLERNPFCFSDTSEDGCDK